MKSLSNADNSIEVAIKSGNWCLLILIYKNLYKNKFQTKSAFRGALKHVINSSV